MQLKMASDVSTNIQTDCIWHKDPKNIEQKQMQTIRSAQTVVIRMSDIPNTV